MSELDLQLDSAALERIKVFLLAQGAKPERVAQLAAELATFAGRRFRDAAAIHATSDRKARKIVENALDHTQALISFVTSGRCPAEPDNHEAEAVQQDAPDERLLSVFRRAAERELQDNQAPSLPALHAGLYALKDALLDTLEAFLPPHKLNTKNVRPPASVFR